MEPEGSTRQRSEPETEILAETLRALLDGLEVGVIVTDRHGNTTHANRAALVAGPGACVGEDAPLARALRGESVAGVELVIRDPDGGGPRFVSVDARPVGSDGDPRGAVVLLTDVTERVRRDEELARVQREFESFVRIASHDLQGPLRIIEGFTGLIAREIRGRHGSELDEYLHHVVDGAARMRQMVRGLCELSWAGRGGGSADSVDLSSLVHAVLGALPDTGAAFEVDALPVVEGDEAALRLLLEHLVSNALKFRSEVDPRVRIGAERRGPDWVVSVEDNGIGIREGLHERVFEPFVRLHRREEYEGVGIGLAICDRIVRRHRGRIWAEAQRAGGTAIRFTLPVRTERAA